MINKQAIYRMLHQDQGYDYQRYLNTDILLRCQKDFDQLCNRDELQFQIVHQVEELWMKLIVYTLLDADEQMQRGNTNLVLTLFKRIHLTQKMMIHQLELLETMSPFDYQQIRQQLGNGSGQESPGFQTLLSIPKDLWHTFEQTYLQAQGLTVEHVYRQYHYGDAYMVAECLAEFDELFQKFCYHHLQLIYRSIGFDAKSLKGRSVELLGRRLTQKLFPELWRVRTRMTEAWGAEFGVVRDHLTAE